MSGTESSIRIVLVEDHDMVAEAVELAFAPIVDFEVVSRAGSIEGALTEIRLSQPDVVILDRRLPDGDGISAIAHIRTAAPTARVLVLTGEATAAVAARVVEAGGAGLVVKSARLTELIAAVRQVARGEAAFGPELLRDVLDRLAKRPTAVGATLTSREREMLLLLAEGKTIEEITSLLHLARSTVRNHVQRILAKLGAHSQLEAVVIARREGLID